MDECRKQFEQAMHDVFKTVVGSNDPYPAGLERDYWKVWQAAWNRRAETQVPEVALYHELLFAVASKFPNESRHQTALRYINSAEHGQTKVGTMLVPEVKQ